LTIFNMTLYANRSTLANINIYDLEVKMSRGVCFDGNTLFQHL